MSLVKIRSAFEVAVNAITPTIPTAYENINYTPSNGVDYQELYLLPAINEDISIESSDFVSKGIFQITLKYKTGRGSYDIATRADLYVKSFKTGRKLIKDDVTVIVMDTPKVINLGTSGDRIIYAISINYRAYITVL